MTYLFLATGFLCSDKIARELAAEIWIKANSENTMNNDLLGKIIGKLELNEYAPLKRFTDLIGESLYNISNNHNKKILEVLDTMIPEMNNKPLRGTKKIIEYFVELKLKFNQFIINDLTKQKLILWKETKSLKPVINKII